MDFFGGIVTGFIIGGVIVSFAWALCVTAGRASRLEEELYWKNELKHNKE